MDHKNGTYVGLRILPPSGPKLYEFCRQSGILVNKSSFDRRLHTTVLYSRKPCPLIVPDPEMHIARFEDFALFTNHDEGKDTVLVVKLNAPSVVARHIKLMAEHGASYDFPTFQPHITLSMSFYGDPKKLKPIDFQILLGQEYVEAMDTEWS